MKVLVCIKQVPGSNNVEVDPVTGVLKRSGIKSKMNPYDLYAIEPYTAAFHDFVCKVKSPSVLVGATNLDRQLAPESPPAVRPASLPTAPCWR